MNTEIKSAAPDWYEQNDELQRLESVIELTMKQVFELQKENEELKNNAGGNVWIKASERLPEFGQLITYVRDTGDNLIYESGFWCKEDLKYWKMNNITHWMLLPNPPNNDEQPVSNVSEDVKDKLFVIVYKDFSFETIDEDMLDQYRDKQNVLTILPYDLYWNFEKDEMTEKHNERMYDKVIGWIDGYKDAIQKENVSGDKIDKAIEWCASNVKYGSQKYITFEDLLNYLQTLK